MRVVCPRIYNLFPLLAGPIASWHEHLPRIAGMGFDWVYVNPFHYAGFSGSLYAIKDLSRLHLVVKGDSEADDDALVAGFTATAREHGLAVMADLVINHTAKDALLVEDRPDWFVREADGSLRSPRAIDPVDPRQVTVWGDLAEIDWSRAEHRAAQLGFWGDYVERMLRLGIRGFRCDAAYQVPADVWAALIAHAREHSPDVVFAAETLGCTPEQVTALGGAGFDLMFNSSKWWDFRAEWLLDQQELYRGVAPTVAFPESHDTERLAAEHARLSPEALERLYRFRWLFAATFSAGVMMPMGFEYGFAKRMDVVTSRPGNWQWEADRHRRFDLTDWIGTVNRLKAAIPALGVEGPTRRLTAPHAPVVALLRTMGGRDEAYWGTGAALILLNPDPVHTHTVDLETILRESGLAQVELRDVTPNAAPIGAEPGARPALRPLEARVLAAEDPAKLRAPPRRPTRSASESAIARLAARRIAIEGVWPEIDGGRHPVKRVIGDALDVEADILGEGHDLIAARLLYRRPRERDWQEAPMRHVDNDRWRGTVPLTRIGRWSFTIEAWRDLFGQWRLDVAKKHEAGLAIALELEEGRLMVERARTGAEGDDAAILDQVLERFAAAAGDGDRLALLLDERVRDAMARADEKNGLTRYEGEPAVVVDRLAARFAAWYEMFPRSQSGSTERHGTFRDVIARLPYVRDLGFDVLYFTPIHPIGRTNRKGRNNSLTPGPDDPGSPYAIGSAEGGHTAIHPELGTLDDFRDLVAAAHEHDLEIALDFAIQCSPDHPWLKHHPEWFDWRPDGTIKYAENPPKKYEDIVNVHFYREAIPGIWLELRDVVLFWAEQGVKTFRVDNPHTKPFPFWEWMIGEVKALHPDAVFLSEAFTRPKVMNRLAKIGFTQSYTYFTWRNTKAELTEYLTQLTQTEVREYFRPNFFVNTPDINPAILQTSERPAYEMRFVLAATLSGVYGIYNGFEICEGAPFPGKEEYLDSEKYEIRAWDFDRPGNIRGLIARVNRIRRANPALHDHLGLLFLNAWNDHVLAYARMTPSRDNVIVVAVNLDHRNVQEAHFEVPLWEFGLPDDAAIEVEDLLSDTRFTWHGKVQHVSLDPADSPCAIWRLVPPGTPR